MQTTRKLRGDQGYERIIMISMQIFTILFFVTIIATDGNPTWIGGDTGIMVIYFFTLANNRKDKIISQQKKISGIINWESWTVSTSENAEFMVYGIKNIWKLTQISRAERNAVEQTIEIYKSKPQPLIIEHVQTVQPTLPQIIPISPEFSSENSNLSENTNNDTQSRPINNSSRINIHIPDLNDVLSQSDHIEIQENSENATNLNAGAVESVENNQSLTDEEIPTVDYDPDDPDEKNIENNLEKIIEISPEPRSKPELDPSIPSIKKTNRKKKRGKKV